MDEDENAVTQNDHSLVRARSETPNNANHSPNGQSTKAKRGKKHKVIESGSDPSVTRPRTEDTDGDESIGSNADQPTARMRLKAHFG